LDRLISETTPQGTISYTYDAADRRISMTVAGQPTVNYTYDNANRLTQLTQGSLTVTVAYNNAGLRSSVTLPNGVVTEYSYDPASQLIGLTYKLGQTVLGDITYEYDANGNRSRTGGSWARSVPPEPLTSASYNAANRQLTFGNKTLSYDLNGNLTGDGTNTYNWDARNRLVSISGPNLSASFEYDAAGRRRSTTINGTMRTFLFDGPNIVQEQSVQLGAANLLTGGLDEIFSRSDSSGVVSPLVDALGVRCF
jgi:YD repeat-containing protein